MSYKKGQIISFTYFLISMLIAKIILAIYLPLTHDEAYTIAVARELSISFFDHPPLGFWSPILSSYLFNSEAKLVFRLPFILYGLGTSIFLFLIGKELYNYNCGLWSAILYNAAPFFFFSGGLLIVPDGPLNLALSIATYTILRIHDNPTKPQYQYYWFLLGIALAVGFASKYQG